MGRDADTHVRVTEETWKELNRRKGPGDSFDDIIGELLREDAGDDPDATEAETDGGTLTA